MFKKNTAVAGVALGVVALVFPAFAQAPNYPPPPAPYPQAPYPQAPYSAPAQLDQLVERVALYPDPLLAYVLTASTFSNQIPDAAAWADQHSYLTGDALAQAISEDNLPWDPSVLALLPFPSVLDMMAQDPAWTQALGNAVLDNRPSVMAAVQDVRQRALSYGYLQDNPQERVYVAGPGNIQILPANPQYIYVPVYNPGVIFVRPRGPRYGVGITFGRGVFVGGMFAPLGWGGAGFRWHERSIVINRQPWRYEDHRHAYMYREGPRAEHHDFRGRPEHGEHGHGDHGRGDRDDRR